MTTNNIFKNYNFTEQKHQNIAEKLWVRNLSVCEYANDVYFGDYISKRKGVWKLSINNSFLMFYGEYNTTIYTEYCEFYTFKKRKDLILKLQELENAAKKN
jgi:hypothetical protein